MTSLARRVRNAPGSSRARPAPRPRESEPCSVTLADGARAEAAGEALRVFSKRGELLFEYDAVTGRTRVSIPDGDLEIATRRGAIDLVAAEGIRLSSPKRLELSSTELGVQAERGDLRLRETTFAGERLSGFFDSLKLAARRSESVAETVIAKARNVYRSVDELAQLEAGRVRTFVSDLYQLHSRTASLKAKKAFRVDGEKIHLG